MDENKTKKYPSDGSPPNVHGPISICLRCGTCCKKGGPSLHLEDRYLVEQGIILLKHLFTIRKGEWAYDNVKGSLRPVKSDIVKIKGSKNSWACRFFDSTQNSCEIYDNRPLECKTLKCWDTREIKQIYNNDRLTRTDLLFNIKWLWELVDDHQTQCNFDQIHALINAFKAGNDNSVLFQLMERVRYDTSLRKVVVEKGLVDPDHLDFILGRPLSQILPLYGLDLKKKRKSNCGNND